MHHTIASSLPALPQVLGHPLFQEKSLPDKHRRAVVQVK
jgi:hypothetical protein